MNTNYSCSNTEPCSGKLRCHSVFMQALWLWQKSARHRDVLVFQRTGYSWSELKIHDSVDPLHHNRNRADHSKDRFDWQMLIRLMCCNVFVIVLAVLVREDTGNYRCEFVLGTSAEPYNVSHVFNLDGKSSTWISHAILYALPCRTYRSHFYALQDQISNRGPPAQACASSSTCFLLFASHSHFCCCRSSTLTTTESPRDLLLQHQDVLSCGMTSAGAGWELNHQYC